MPAGLPAIIDRTISEPEVGPIKIFLFHLLITFKNFLAEKILRSLTGFPNLSAQNPVQLVAEGIQAAVISNGCARRGLGRKVLTLANSFNRTPGTNN